MTRGLVGAITLVVCTGTTAAPQRGLTAAPLVAQTYDSILNANFADVPASLARACGPAPREACATLETVGLLWRVSLDPDDRSLDGTFTTAVETAIGATEAWTMREPERAEAWFYHGAAYGARVQWRVLRGERLGAARDGRRVKEALERALQLDPEMHDAEFGVGVYRYYAAVAPAALRMLRWLLWLPGGDRQGGLQQMVDASLHGELVRGEAEYQLHLAYLWYEHRVDDALRLIDSLRTRYPKNPLFHQARAQILDTYLHDQIGSVRAWEDLAARARARSVNEPELAGARARVKAAELFVRLGNPTRATDLLQQVVKENPARPLGIVSMARALLARMPRQ